MRTERWCSPRQSPWGKETARDLLFLAGSRGVLQGQLLPCCPRAEGAAWRTVLPAARVQTGCSGVCLPLKGIGALKG